MASAGICQWINCSQRIPGSPARASYGTYAAMSKPTHPAIGRLERKLPTRFIVQTPLVMIPAKGLSEAFGDPESVLTRITEEVGRPVSRPRHEDLVQEVGSVCL